MKDPFLSIKQRESRYTISTPSFITFTLVNIYLKSVFFLKLRIIFFLSSSVQRLDIDIN